MFDGTQELAENKLLLLYIFNRIQHPLSNSNVTEIVLENNLMNYFHLQQYLSELVSSGFLTLHKEDNRQLYTISHKGKNVLEFFENRITDSKKEIIKSYLDNNSNLIKEQIEITADSFPSNEKGYTAACKIINNKVSLIELKINVKSHEEARDICLKWKSNASQMYARIKEILTD